LSCAKRVTNQSASPIDSFPLPPSTMWNHFECVLLVLIFYLRWACSTLPKGVSPSCMGTFPGSSSCELSPLNREISSFEIQVAICYQCIRHNTTLKLKLDYYTKA
jgi:hypothetical protein